MLGVVSTLRRGTRSTCAQIIGDSTGTDPDEWFGVMIRNLAALFPAYTLLWRQWNDTTQEYDLPTGLRINTASPTAPFQVGTANGGTERLATLTSGGMNWASWPTNTGDHDIRAKIAPSTSWAPGGAAATRTILSHYNASGSNRGWVLWLNASGFLNWTWSAAGTADTATATSTLAVPFTGTNPGWVRVVHDLDNGATGSDVKFYTSTDGATWTQLGTTVTTAGVTSIAAAVGTTMVAGSRNGGGADYFNGDFYWVEARSGIQGISVCPPMLDDWDQITTATSVAFNGAPVLMALCGSQSGQNLAYFNDPTRRPKLLIPHGQDAVFISTSHNEGNATNTTWLTAFAAYATAMKTALPNVPIIPVAQNPTGPTLAQNIREQRAARGAQLMTYAAATAGLYGVDPWPAFIGADLSVVIEPSDGIHPTQSNSTDTAATNGTAGSDLWGLYLFRYLFAG